jgi:hypothetical protein
VDVAKISTPLPPLGEPREQMVVRNVSKDAGQGDLSPRTYASLKYLAYSEEPRKGYDICNTV